MRRAKEDALETRQKIIEVAFELFNDKGFMGTSLEQIAKEADVTRGAVYWHFKDKKELYAAVLHMVLDEGSVSKFARELSTDLTYEERMYEVFLCAIEDNEKVDFVYKALNTLTFVDGLSDLKEEIQMEKIAVFQYFVEETRQHMKLRKLSRLKPEYYAADLFLLFEGLFLTKNVSIGLLCDKEHIMQYVKLIIEDLL